MTGEVLDASRQQGHLHLRRAGVVRHAAVVSNDLAGLFCGKGHGYLFLQNADAELVQPHRPVGLHKLRWLDVKLWNKLAIVARAGGWQQERGPGRDPSPSHARRKPRGYTSGTRQIE